MLKRKLPPKSPIPPHSQTMHWKERYYDVGDVVKFQHPLKDTKHEGQITAIKLNQYGRVSYSVGEHLVFLEDIARVMNPQPIVAR